ncbi:SDR family NAD(P)-dependent oxidoreductase [Streptomyces sp. DHE17-7]|uniref:SDR family NAD(P)-dependent oxidoreductase n=1 Tax=Streptomyces sp. DHE17-7 TaxID=2759949 RepID=UPI0022EA4A4B|nr:SDR family NAD(P)-dependent oxidoreductase [Streptomyces sp. DHE17-7]MBJ6618135.1 SDR family oxidoreductase [Streptomyces sp. DHE17-7]
MGAALARACACASAPGPPARGPARLSGHEKPLLDAAAEALPAPVLAVEADVTDPAALEAAAGEVRAHLGPPSVVVANAGIALGGPFATSDPDEWGRRIGRQLTCSATRPAPFLARPCGRTGGASPPRSRSLAFNWSVSAYCGLQGRRECFAFTPPRWRAEVAHHGIAVGIAYLNWIDTDMIREPSVLAVPALNAAAHAGATARRIEQFPADRVPDRPDWYRAVERRSTAVYVPRWLRLAQVGRTALPPLVLRVARRDLPRLEADGALNATGPLGAGGTADRGA